MGAGYDYLTGSRAIHNNACLIQKISVTGPGEGSTYATIYDGNNTTASVVMVIRVAATETFNVDFNPPLELNRGLYVAFSANLESVTVISSPRERNKELE